MKKLVLYLLLVGLPVLLAGYAAEYWLWHKSGSQLREIAEKFGVSYDPRSKIQVVRDLRATGGRAHLYVPPETLFRSQGGGFVPALRSADGASYLQPLGSISNSENVVCNESGAWFRFKSDRHGFNNPDDIWDRDRVDVLALGDSFALGNCVPQGKGMVDLVRREFPATLNLGAGGNGPLIQLAALKEYGLRYKPRTVVWFFYANDLMNLAKEEFNPLLSSYLSDAAHSQSLISRQGEIDQGLSRLVAGIMEGDSVADARFYRILRLQKLRHILFSGQRLGSFLEDRLYRQYEMILARAAAMISGWNGQLLFVGLAAPAAQYFPDDASVRDRAAQQEKILAIARRMNLATVELTPVFRAAADPKSLSYGPAAHYSEAGYALAAGSLIPEIRKLLEAE